MRYIFFILLSLFSLKIFAEDTTNVKARKISYSEFMTDYAFDDTSRVIVNIFFDKKNNTAKGQMSFFPITAAIYPLFAVISVATSAVSFPFFLNGSYLLIKYRKARLVTVLHKYKHEQYLSKGLRKKVTKALEFQSEIQE